MKSRVLTAIGLIPFVLGAIFCAHPLPFFALGLAALIACSNELLALLKRPAQASVLAPVCGTLLVTALLPQFAGGHSLPIPVVSALAVLIASAIGCGCALDAAKRTTAWTWVLAPFWYLAAFWSLIALHCEVPAHTLWYWRNPVLLAILPLWAGDTAAYVVGKSCGKHLLAPAISPKKTIEGSLANLVACVAVAAPLGLWLAYSWQISVLCGLAAGVLGQAGDLFESAVKRRAGVKDSGSLLPGHGGLLDRVDSLLFTSPVVLLLVTVSHAFMAS